VRQRTVHALVLGTLLLSLLACEPQPPQGTELLYRVNAGGGAVSDWTADTEAAPSPYVNASGSHSVVETTSAAIDPSHASVPPGTPMALLQDDRRDAPAGADMSWQFPVPAGQAVVRLYFAEIDPSAFAVGQRVFDVEIENQRVIDDLDVFAAVGAEKALVLTWQVTTDAQLDIDFLREIGDPQVGAFEISSVVDPQAVAPPVAAQPASLDLGNMPVGFAWTATVDVVNQAPAGGASVHLTGATVTGNPDFTDDFGGPVTLAPGASYRISVRFAPAVVGPRSATLRVDHDGANPPLTIPLSGMGTSPGATPPSFAKSVLAGTSSDAPTTLQWGPDGRLYVGQSDGTIVVYDVTRATSNDYRVTATERIDLVRTIPNHNDDGSPNPAITTRLVTGILVTGTTTSPVIYVNSSDPRVGGGGNGIDTGLDTNSGVLSRLTRNGAAWTRTDLVRGLPRSENVHQGNGLVLDSVTNTLFLAQGGNTNRGAPSLKFAYTPEYALSGAILSFDLDAIGSVTYDLPTLDDETRPGAIDANDPFGGNDGLNQAKLVPGGPVQIYEPGFRNPYDLALTNRGELYATDNGPNNAWGGVPVGEGPGGTCTNDPVDGGLPDDDSLMHVRGPGFFGGHANPTRGNVANTFNPSNPQSPVPASNPVECDWRTPTERGALVRFGDSTDGMVEYTASTFGGALRGDLLVVGYANAIQRVKLNATGDGVLVSDTLASSVGIIPLDITTQSDGGAFPGTLWVADYVADTIFVFEPT
jgi:hypothetical protein